MIDIHLLKCLEQFFFICGTYANASVDDVDRSQRVPIYWSRVQFNLHLSLVGKLDSVVSEVNQNLAENSAIRFQPQTALRRLHFELQAFVLCERPQGGGDLFDYALTNDGLV